MPVTLEKVAAQAGVSMTTASQALRGREGVAARTRQRVLMAAEQLDYDTRRVPRGRPPKLKAVPRIGMVVVGDLYHSASLAVQEFIRGAEQQIAERQGELVLEWNPSGLPRCYESGRVNALVIFGRPTPTYLRQFSGIPVACCSNPVLGSSVPEIVQDNRGGIEMVMRLLIDRGHRRISFVSHSNQAEVFRLRSLAYASVMHDAGLDPHIVTDAQHVRECADALMERVLQASPTAIVAGNDTVAYALMVRLEQRGVCIPQEMSITGFDHGGQHDWHGLRLTTVDGRMAQVGREAMRFLAQQIDAMRREQIQIVVPAQLVEGQTVAPPRSGDV